MYWGSAAVKENAVKATGICFKVEEGAKLGCAAGGTLRSDTSRSLAGIQMQSFAGLENQKVDWQLAQGYLLSTWYHNARRHILNCKQCSLPAHSAQCQLPLRSESCGMTSRLAITWWRSSHMLALSRNVSVQGLHIVGYRVCFIHR